MGGTVMLVDTFGRVHRDLRISLTDKCSLRCTYCMPAEGVPWIERDSTLTADEVERVVRVCVDFGVTEIRRTGGEPLIRKDVVELVHRLVALGPEVSMTTNGIRLGELAEPLRSAGLSRLNISIDTLDRNRLHQLNRRDKLLEVMAGIDAARAAGFTPLKLNALAMRGVNDDELIDLVHFANGMGAQMRFIERMPLDAGHTWDRGEMVPAGRDTRHAAGAVRLVAGRQPRVGTGRPLEHRRRPRHCGNHRVGHGTFLRCLRPDPHHGGRPRTQLSLRPGRTKLLGRQRPLEPLRTSRTDRVGPDDWDGPEKAPRTNESRPVDASSLDTTSGPTSGTSSK